MFLHGQANYDYQVITHHGVEMLVIWDRYDSSNPSMSVTNAAERVLQEIHAEIGPLPKTIIYDDSEGEWDYMRIGEQDPNALDFRVKFEFLGVDGARVKNEAEAKDLAAKQASTAH